MEDSTNFRQTTVTGEYRTRQQILPGINHIKMSMKLDIGARVSGMIPTRYSERVPTNSLNCIYSRILVHFC